MSQDKTSFLENLGHHSFAGPVRFTYTIAYQTINRLGTDFRCQIKESNVDGRAKSANLKWTVIGKKKRKEEKKVHLIIPCIEGLQRSHLLPITLSLTMSLLLHLLSRGPWSRPRTPSEPGHGGELAPVPAPPCPAAFTPLPPSFLTKNCRALPAPWYSCSFPPHLLSWLPLFGALACARHSFGGYKKKSAGACLATRKSHCIMPCFLFILVSFLARLCFAFVMSEAGLLL